ncbi:MAG: hypothetical protein JSS02_08955 [Planctomycetes bacterium]|nr:hypothetical protein [Planctomycetota bacterium]
MISGFVRHSVRGLTTMTLVVVAGWLCTPATAQASCGDYVTLGRPQSLVGASHAVTPDVPTSDQRRSPNCRGPLCSNHSFPPASPAPRLEFVVEHWALIGDAAWSAPPLGHARAPETLAVTCDGVGLGILRPPR